MCNQRAGRFPRQGSNRLDRLEAEPAGFKEAKDPLGVPGSPLPLNGVGCARQVLRQGGRHAYFDKEVG
jgi:hypothetical protein